MNIIYLWNGKNLAEVQKATFHLPRIFGQPAATVKQQNEKEHKNGFELTIQGREVPYGAKITVDDRNVTIDKRPVYRDNWNAFGVYSWGSYFESITLSQLLQLRQTWFRAVQRSTGHEREVMAYNMRQLNDRIIDLQNE